MAVFDRARDGTLTQKPGLAGCISETGIRCQDGTALDGAQSVTISPNGHSAYVASAFSDAVAVFDRRRNGKLVQKSGTAGCISGSGAGPCVDGTALNFPTSVALSPDGQSAYVPSSGSNAVAVFNRAAHGTLAQKRGTAGCVREGSGAGRCTGGAGLENAESVRSAPTGKTPTSPRASATPWRCSTGNRAAPAAGHDESPRSDH